MVPWRRWISRAASRTWDPRLRRPTVGKLPTAGLSRCVNEAPYRIDRMLFHLREAGKFEDVRGVIFGEMKDCGPTDLLRETIVAAFEGMNIPLAIGLHTGHTSGRNICVPLGVRARLDGDRLTFLEGAVS